jgi:amidase
VPATGHFPVCGGPFGLTGVVGPMARTVADVGLLLEAMAGPDIGDPNGHPVPLVSAAQVAPPLRVGWFEDDGRTPVTGETREAVRAAVKALDGAGFEVVPFATDLLEEARALWWELFGRALRLLLEPLVKGREADVHPNLLEFLDWTRDLPRITAERLLEVEIARDALRTRFAARMVEVPVIVCPVSAVPAFRHGEREWMVDGRRVHYLDAWSYTAWFNLLQNPALSVPAGRSAEGLPIGVQVVARPWEEHMALGVAAVIEDALGGYVPPPI